MNTYYVPEEHACEAIIPVVPGNWQKAGTCFPQSLTWANDRAKTQSPVVWLQEPGLPNKWHPALPNLQGPFCATVLGL